MSDVLRDRVQTALGSAYTLERELGGGGMSRVFIARDEALGRHVVVKVLAPELAEGLSEERFTREIRLAAGLQEPHIVPVHSAGVTADGLPWYTMPFVEGESLRARMQRGPVPAPEAVKILADVARALAYAHARGIVHRDIKPENVLLSSGTAVVTDFGIAKALSESRTHAPGGTLTVVGTSLGTPAYMAPEQAAGDDVDGRADLYAWGIMAYELLAGRHPYEGKTTAQQLIAAHISEAPRDLGALETKIPRALAALVMRALEKSPARRPQSAAALLDALDACGSSAARWSPARLIAAATVALALAAVIVAIVARTRSTPSAQPDEMIMLAVLPFDNQGPPDTEYFADGVTDAISSKLATIHGLGVIAQRSAAQYKHTTKPLRQVGRELGAAYVLDGVVRWAPMANGSPGTRQAQIVPRLVRASDATTRWAGEPIVITPSDPFRAQSEIAAKVAAALDIALNTSARAAIERRPTQNAQAYDEFLRGETYRLEAMRSGYDVRPLPQAIAHYERAVALDPAFALAYARLGFVYGYRAVVAGGDKAELARSARGVDAAVRLDSTLGETWLAHGYYLWATGDIAHAMTDFDRAAALAPGDAEIAASRAGFSFAMGRSDSAFVWTERAIRLDPRSPALTAWAANNYGMARRFAESEALAARAVALDSTAEAGHVVRVLNALYLRADTVAAAGRLTEALRFVTSPSASLLNVMSLVRGPFRERYVALGLGTAASLGDTVGAYYDSKADFYTAIGRPDAVRAYRDSIMVTLEGRTLVGTQRPTYDALLALSYAALGRGVDARRLIGAVRNRAQQPDRGTIIEANVDRTLAAAYTVLGEKDSAVVLLERALSLPDYSSRAWFRIDPRYLGLHGYPKFEALTRARP